MGTLPLVFGFLLGKVFCSNWDHFEMDPSHLKYLPEVKKTSPSDLCWGYEPRCSFSKSYSNSIGFGTCSKGLEGHRELFYKQADFGYVADRAELNNICQSDTKEGSSLRCSENLEYCYATNLFFDLRSFDRRNTKMYRNDIIHKGEVGGHCQKNFDGELLAKHAEHKNFLTTWAAEMEHFTSDEGFNVDEEHCDVIFERPTIVMKLDAAVNMYHHFCDFFNLYASQHINGSFDRDVDIVWWETGSAGYMDSTFGVTWDAFSRHTPVELISLAGKRVCFKEAMLPLLARQRYGLYYNSLVAQGCSGSGLFHAFTQHVLHRLGLPPPKPDLEVVRVTFLARNTHHRKILNMDELESAASRLAGVRISVVSFDHRMPFVDQLKLIRQSDVLLGIHGAGLTHLLFLPDWAAVYEIYHCEDRGCYKDLARLRGVQYFTWPDDKIGSVRPEETEGRSEKFRNYRIDPEEFTKQVAKAAEWVRRSPRFVEARRQLRRSQRAEL